MLDKKLLAHKLKDLVGGCIAAALAAMALYGGAADELALNKRMCENTESMALPSVNDTESLVTVNINTASVHHLQRLKGIGKVKAEAVKKYREEHGGFKSVDELANVKGIDKRILEDNLGKITI